MSNVVVALIAFVSLGMGVFGLLLASQATQGVALIALACLFMIFARILQADAHRAADLKQFARPTTPEPKTPQQVREQWLGYGLIVVMGLVVLFGIGSSVASLSAEPNSFVSKRSFVNAKGAR